jgi:hypothetical protein
MRQNSRLARLSGTRSGDSGGPWGFVHEGSTSRPAPRFALLGAGPPAPGHGGSRPTRPGLGAGRGFGLCWHRRGNLAQSQAVPAERHLEKRSDGDPRAVSRAWRAVKKKSPRKKGGFRAAGWGERWGWGAHGRRSNAGPRNAFPNMFPKYRGSKKFSLSCRYLGGLPRVCFTCAQPKVVVPPPGGLAGMVGGPHRC